MSIDYTLYTELYVKDKWYGIDSYIHAPAGEYRLSPLLRGKSYVRRFLDNLNDCQTIHFSDLAETTQKYMIEQTDERYQEQLVSARFEVYDFYAEVKSKYVRKYQYEYYTPRFSIAAFEIGEIDAIDDWLTRESYEELSPEEQKDYVFFKWTEPDSWYKTLANVVTRVEMRLADFWEESSWCNDDFRKHLQHINPIRLIVEKS